ncbi:MAG: DUF2690 domain-containing protein [Pseudolysinimonas sp.]
MTLAVAAATVVVLGLGASPAQATNGYGYDGTNPATTGCATGSYAIGSWPIKVNGTGATVGTMEVRYSPRCGTNWVRVNNTLAGYQALKYISRASPWAEQGEIDAATGWSYGMQYYAPGSTCVDVSGQIFRPSGGVNAWSGDHLVC